MKDGNKLIYLATGVVITILFFVFRADLFEQLYYSNAFSNEMYNTDTYAIVAALTIGITWLGAAVYYYVINSVRFDRWYHWLAVAAVVTVLTPIVVYLVAAGQLAGTDYQGELLTYSLLDTVWTFLLFVIASFSMRWWSTNCRHTPFPQ